MRNISSAEGAAPVWNQFFEEFLKDKPAENFPKPERIVKSDICSLSGELYDSVCPERKTEIFIKGTEPQKISSLHRMTLIDKRNGLLATGSCPDWTVEKRLLIDYPNEVYSWAVANNKPYIPHENSPLCGNFAVPVDQPEALSVTITNPKNKAVFQNAPELIRNQGISLEVNVSDNIKSVSWYVDNIKIGETTSAPFSLFTRLRTGNHIVYAEGRSGLSTVRSDTVNFSVTDIR
jgi:membrane carboxypeptidase/penicillin-binding protein PbpC